MRIPTFRRGWFPNLPLPPGKRTNLPPSYGGNILHVIGEKTPRLSTRPFGTLKQRSQ